MLWAVQVVVSLVLLQTLFFKFSGAEESVWIFTQLGVEPWGRYAAAFAELLAAMALLTPPAAAFGALVAAGIGAGAVLSHLFVLGVDVLGDGGLLFGLAWLVLLGSAWVVWMRRERLVVLRRQPLRPVE